MINYVGVYDERITVICLRTNKTAVAKLTFAEQNGFAVHVLFGGGLASGRRVGRFFHEHSVHPRVAHAIESLKRPQSLHISLVWVFSHGNAIIVSKLWLCILHINIAIICKSFCRRKMKQNFPRVRVIV